MERRSVVLLCALSAAAVAALLVTDAKPGVDVLAILLETGVAAAASIGYCGQYLILCPGEAFAIALGTASPVLGVLFQPVIAGVLVFHHILYLLLALLLASAGMTFVQMGFEGLMHDRLSSGSAT